MFVAGHMSAMKGHSILKRHGLNRHHQFTIGTQTFESLMVKTSSSELYYLKKFVWRSINNHRAQNSKIAPKLIQHLEFGQHVSDHMLVCDYDSGEWEIPKLVPFANLSISPTSLALHYGQTVFEGMKSFRMEDGRINIFRIEKHYDRLVRSLERMCMAIVPKEIFMEGLKQLITLDRNWIPGKRKCTSSGHSCLQLRQSLGKDLRAIRVCHFYGPCS
jgi:hypothetical protein